MIDSPVTLTTMGIGALSPDEDAFTGMIGMHGTKTTSLAVKNCDLVIAVGARFSDRVICDPNTFARNAKIVHIDVDKAEINKNIRTDAHIIGDAAAVLDELNKRLSPVEHKEWMAQVVQVEGGISLYPQRQGGLLPYGDYRRNQECRQAPTHIWLQTLVSTRCGQRSISALKSPVTLYLHWVSAPWASAWVRLSGAQVAHPDNYVVNVTGDGCFHMNLQELSTAAKQGLPVIEVIMNNNVLGMVRQWQRLFYEKRFSNTTLDKLTDYNKVAEGLGANGITVSTIDELKNALETAKSSRNKPTVINCLIHQDDLVLPMVPGGQSIEKPILEIKIDDDDDKEGK